MHHKWRQIFFRQNNIRYLIDSSLFPEVTFENSPKKLNLIYAMKYILEYLRNERYIMFPSGSEIRYEIEYAISDIPIGYRVIVNDKDIDVVVWYADYLKWLEKYSSLNIKQMYDILPNGQLIYL